MSSQTMSTSRETSGFDFDYCERNRGLVEGGVVTAAPRFVKTGTTIGGLVFEGGVVLGADTRATAGPLVADKVCRKLQRVADNIYLCGAGTAADLHFMHRKLGSEMELHRLAADGRAPRVATCARRAQQYLFNYQGNVSAALILGGVDCTGATLCSVAPDGHATKSQYTAQGSGSLAAMAELEAGYRRGMTRDAAVRLMRDAIVAGIRNDMGSGSNVDLVVISAGGKVEELLPYELIGVKGERLASYMVAPGTTDVLRKTVKKIDFDVVSTRIVLDGSSAADAMET